MALLKEFFLENPKEILKHPAFLFFLAAKIIVSGIWGSKYISGYFIPFITYFVDSGFSNPYDYFYQLGQVDSFPYSPMMLVILSIPFIPISFFVEQTSTIPHNIQLFLFRMPLLVCDFLCLSVLCAWIPKYKKAILYLFWCSPIVFYIAYIHGQIDLVPTALFLLSIYFLLKSRFLISGGFLGLGIATKFHLLAAIPFLLFYFYNNSMRQENRLLRSAKYFLSMLLIAGCFIVPMLSSEGFQSLVLQTGEMQKFFKIQINLSEVLDIYLGPALALLILLRFASQSRVNWISLLCHVMAVLAVLALAVPSMPAWYLWFLPFMYLFFAIQPYARWWPVVFSSIAYLVYFLAIRDQEIAEKMISGASVNSLAFTTLQISMVYCVFHAFKHALRMMPKDIGGIVSVAIGGDSGSGKHTLANSLFELVHPKNVTSVYGDDYHRWERENTKWKAVTHLNPAANEMFRIAEHLQKLKAGFHIDWRNYDHSSGKFSESKTIRSNKFLFFIGLHPYYLRSIRSNMDLKIFLDPDENLREEWKIERDQQKRGYSKDQIKQQIESRKADASKYIQPQKQFADWVIRYTKDKDQNFCVKHSIRNDLAIEPLVLNLQKVPDLTVEWSMDTDLQNQQLTSSGSISAAEIESIAKQEYPNINEILFNEQIQWQANSIGITQLIFVAFIASLEHDTRI